MFQMNEKLHKTVNSDLDSNKHVKKICTKL